MGGQCHSSIFEWKLYFEWKARYRVLRGRRRFLNPNTVYPVNNVEFNDLFLTSSPVPESSILGLLGAGLASIMALRRSFAFC